MGLAVNLYTHAQVLFSVCLELRRSASPVVSNSLSLLHVCMLVCLRVCLPAFALSTVHLRSSSDLFARVCPVWARDGLSRAG